MPISPLWPRNVFTERSSCYHNPTTVLALTTKRGMPWSPYWTSEKELMLKQGTRHPRDQFSVNVSECRANVRQGWSSQSPPRVSMVWMPFTVPLLLSTHPCLAHCHSSFKLTDRHPVCAGISAVSGSSRMHERRAAAAFARNEL